jgi:hypothetical protein
MNGASNEIPRPVLPELVHVFQQNGGLALREVKQIFKTIIDSTTDDLLLDSLKIIIRETKSKTA